MKSLTVPWATIRHMSGFRVDREKQWSDKLLTRAARLFDRLREHPAVFWVLIRLVALNIWFDFYHSGGFVLDLIS